MSQLRPHPGRSTNDRTAWAGLFLQVNWSKLRGINRPSLEDTRGRVIALVS
ncbi:hypothetical protein B296_00044857 [Ensete ventricosum]|uniref:Uncharacterized protein n=1 Tax=Ensete ventricosum TaxID=4639 RepID=A0A426Y6I1_ENSVE|nr:hypothetical protein B296_00044857 [Ensete ventricosum]